MKINKIKINSYGKLKNKEINLENNLNIIYGKNESGKSTLLNFILNIFYGASKNKKGKEISDFEKYKPWNSEEFSGKLSYELDNKNNYEIFREFNRKNPIIFNEKGEDISRDFNIDKNKGSEFFFEQTQISEEMFIATSIAMQQEVKIGKNVQQTLVQKISNLLGTGEDNISYKKAIDKLNKKQLDEIGTDRSREKPINILEKNIEINTEKIEELKKYENIKYEIEEEKNNIRENLTENEIKYNILKELKDINKNKQIKIEIKKSIIEENKNKINNLNKKIEEKENEHNQKNKNENKDKKRNKIKNKLNIFLIILILINIFWIIFIPKIIDNKIIKYIFPLTVPMYLIFYIFYKNKLNKNIINENKKQKNILKQIEEEKNDLIKEKNILEKNNNELIEEINKIKQENNLLENLQKEKIIRNYCNKINDEEIKKIFNLENIENEINYLENKINNQKIEINTIEIKKENIEPQLENLSKLEEELSSYKEQYNMLQEKNMAIEIARKLLQKSYDKMKSSVSPIFTEKLSLNISKITKGKYRNLYFSDEQGLTVELENGNYVQAERLSIGTIDQLYLSLRLAILDEVSQENVPIILDESFAYYDDERLKNILLYLIEEFNNRQIILLTCTKREKEILEGENIKFNYIEM